MAANVLAAFDITAPLDEEGNPMFPEVKMCSGLLSSVFVPFWTEHEADTGDVRHPLPFKCVVKPRSARAEGLIHGLLPGRGL